MICSREWDWITHVPMELLITHQIPLKVPNPRGTRENAFPLKSKTYQFLNRQVITKKMNLLAYKDVLFVSQLD
tara:strand:- start:399 stop:617 length:219 start_codon:yes stop_codon:yes gene_type:complete